MKKYLDDNTDPTNYMKLDKPQKISAKKSRCKKDQNKKSDLSKVHFEPKNIKRNSKRLKLIKVSYRIISVTPPKSVAVLHLLGNLM